MEDADADADAIKRPGSNISLQKGKEKQVSTST